MSKRPEQGRRPLGKVVKDELSDMFGGKKKEHQDSGAVSTVFPIDEKNKYTLLCCLLVRLGSQVLKDVFDRIMPPQELCSDLKRGPVHSKLQSLRKEGILNSVQWSKLYPVNPSSVSSTGFGPSLLIVLLRTICNLNCPSSGWDLPPHSLDISCESDIVRLKYCVKALSAHAEEASVSDAAFCKYREQIQNTLVRLGGGEYEDAIRELEKREMDPWDEEHFKELLKQWKDGDDRIKDKLNEWECIMKTSGDAGCRCPDAKDQISVHNTQGGVSFTEQRKPGDIYLKVVLKLASTGAWLAGTAFVLNRYINDPETLVLLFHQVVLPSGVLLRLICGGSIICILQVIDLHGLHTLWQDFESGLLKKNLEYVFITEDLCKLAKGAEIIMDVFLEEKMYHDVCLELSLNQEKDPVQTEGSDAVIGSAAPGTSTHSHHQRDPVQTEGSDADIASAAAGTSTHSHHQQGAVSTVFSSDGKNKYTLLCCLLVRLGSRVLRDVFDRIMPPQELCSDLKRGPVRSKLQSLRKKGILNPVEWSKLYPVKPSSVSSTGFDPSLLIVLLRTICNLSPPDTGWDRLPHSHDTSCESDILRLKYFVDAVLAHAEEASVSDAFFCEYKDQIQKTLVRLGGAEYEEAIHEIEKQEMDPFDEERFKELLKQWKDGDDRIKDKLNEWECVMKTSRDAGAVDGKTKYTLLCCLLVRLGSQVLRDVFDRLIHPQDLCSALKRDPVHSKLQSLRKEGILSQVQWSQVYPVKPSSVSSTGFDPSLLIVLLRTICNLSPPDTGWDLLPHSHDTSCESDIVRLQYFVDAVLAHAEEASVSDAFYCEYEDQIQKTLVRLGGAEYEEAIHEIEKQEMDPFDEERFKELLKQWKDGDDRIKDKLNEWECVMKTSRDAGAVDGKTKYTLLCCLLVRLGSQVLRDVFDRLIHPQDLCSALKRDPVHSKLQSLRKEGILSRVQWSQVYPVKPSSVSSTGFDPSLLIVLLRTICNLSPPDTGWDLLPHSHDTSCESDIVRLQYFVDAVLAHAEEASVSDAFYCEYKDQIQKTLVRLGGAEYEEAIHEMEKQEMDPFDEERFKELLKQWKDGDDRIKDKLNEWECVIKTSRDAGAVDGKTKYTLLCCLLFRLGSQVLRDVFDRLIHPQDLCSALKRDPVHSKLQSLRKEGILSQVQWSQVYPFKPSSVSSTGFDPSLLIVLLRTICNLSPPVTGWDLLPHSLETSCESDIVRLKYFVDAVLAHAEEASVSAAFFCKYKDQIQKTLVRLGGAEYEEAIHEIEKQEMDPFDEEHFKELLKEWKDGDDRIKDKLNEWECVMKTSRDADLPSSAYIIEMIRQLYNTCEKSVVPVPWCEDLNFHVDDIFTNLKIVDKEKTWGTLTDEITNMTAIFKGHKDCAKPRTVLIEGDSGMGKTTYCQKLAYDWAMKREEWDKSFPEIDVLLLLRCRDIKTDIWEAIDDQILPLDFDEEDREWFFKLIRENQSKVLLVLDGLDEVDSSKVDMYNDLLESEVLPNCHIVITSRHEAGKRVRRYCDTLWEIIGFTLEDAECYIFKYFKGKEHLANKLLEHLELDRFAEGDLIQSTRNPLITALLCTLCEDFNGVFPTERTPLYTEIVRCVLLRYEKRIGSSSGSNADLLEVYKDDLLQLGCMALQSLCKGELYFDEKEFKGSSSDLIKFGFLSIQTGGSKRKPSLRCGFLNKGFQEFFAGFYLAYQILDGETDCKSVVTDERNRNELKQVFLFMIGILSGRSEEMTVSLVKSMAELVSSSNKGMKNCEQETLEFALDCILECKYHGENLQSKLLQTFGQNFLVKRLAVNIRFTHVNLFCEILKVNACLTTLDLRGNNVGSAGAESLSEALKVNTCLTTLDLRRNKVGSAGAESLSEALIVNTCLTTLDLHGNEVGSGGAESLSEALKVNTCLTTLDLCRNEVGSAGAESLSEALKVNTCLTTLDLRGNEVGSGGAESLSEALEVNTCLTTLDLCRNKVGSAGAESLSEALKVNTCLTTLDLCRNEVGSPGAESLSDALKVNTCLTTLNLRDNKIGTAGAESLSEALKVNTCLTTLDLSANEVGSAGAESLSEALKVNTCLTTLNLRDNKIGTAGAESLSESLKVNTCLTTLDLSANEVGSAGAESLSEALKVNTCLTTLNLRDNKIGTTGAESLSEALKVNTCLTTLDLSANEVGSAGAESLSEALKVNTCLTTLDLSANEVGSAGAESLSEALKVNTCLTTLDLCGNQVGSAGAESLSNALKVNTCLTTLALSWKGTFAAGADA